MSKPRQRTGLYRTILHEGLHDNLPRYLTCLSAALLLDTATFVAMNLPLPRTVR